VDELEFEGFNAGSVRVPAGSGVGGGGGVVGSVVFCANYTRCATRRSSTSLYGYRLARFDPALHEQF